LSWFVAPTVVAFAVSDSARLFYRRYLVAMIPANYMLTAIWLSVPSARVLRAIGGGAVLVVACWRSAAVDLEQIRLVPPGHGRENWRGAVRHINEHPLKLILVRPHLLEDDYLRSTERERWQEYCRLPLRGLYRVSDSLRIEPLPSTDSGILDRRQSRQLKDAKAAWLLFRGRPETLEKTLDQMRTSLNSFGTDLEIGPRKPYGSNLTLVKLMVVGTNFEQQSSSKVTLTGPPSDSPR
jgi:hypothetical protein